MFQEVGLAVVKRSNQAENFGMQLFEWVTGSKVSLGFR